jgi:hypothetical protein
MPDDPDRPPFDAEELELLLAVFETVCRSLQLLGQSGPPAETIALKVIDAVKTGERDPKRLHDLVLLALRIS